MAKDMVFSNKIKYVGIFNFRNFYEFSFNWLTNEVGLILIEDEYEEKLSGNSKDIKVKWTGKAELAEYFHYDIKIEFRVRFLTEVEVVQDGVKTKTNKGEIKIDVKSFLVKDPEGQFETSGTMKIWRGIYEKFIIPSRVKQYEDKLIEDSNEYISQAKAFLDLEGRQ